MLSTLNFRKPQSAVSTKLLLTAEQRAELANLPPDSFVLEAWTHHDQQHANDFLAQHTLDRRQVSDQETKWKIISGHSRNSTDKEHVSRLYQCACGCHMAARSDVVGKRRTRQRWSFTGCLAFAEVKVRRDNGEIIKVYGYLTHNDQCRAAQPQLLPFPKRKKGADIQAAIASSTQVLVDLEALGAVCEQFEGVVQNADLDGEDKTALVAAARTLKEFVQSPACTQVTSSLMAFQQKHGQSLNQGQNQFKRPVSEMQQAGSVVAGSENAKKQKSVESVEGK